MTKARISRCTTDSGILDSQGGFGKSARIFSVSSAIVGSPGTFLINDAAFY